MKTKFSTRNLVLFGLFIALEIVFTRFLQVSIPLSKDRISLGFIPVSMGGMQFGPLGGGIIAGIADLIRASLLPDAGGAINPLYTVTAVLKGVLYGAFLYKNTDWKRILLVSFLIFLFVNVGLNSAITAFSYGGTFLARVAVKIWPNLANFLLQVAILIPALPTMRRRLR